MPVFFFCAPLGNLQSGAIWDVRTAKRKWPLPAKCMRCVSTHGKGDVLWLELIVVKIASFMWTMWKLGWICARRKLGHVWPVCTVTAPGRWTPVIISCITTDSSANGCGRLSAGSWPLVTCLKIRRSCPNSSTTFVIITIGNFSGDGPLPLPTKCMEHRL